MTQHFKCIAYIFCQSEHGLPLLDFDIVTHVNYAFAIPTKEGHVRPLENPDLAQAVIQKAHENSRRVLISLGGWSYEDIPLEETFRLGTDTPEKIASLAREIVSLAEEFGFDGVDVDWEYPRVNDGSKAQYEALISILHDLLKPKGMLLTAAVLAGVDSRNQPISSACGAQARASFDNLDWINLMTYDCDGPIHASYEFTRNSVDYWVHQKGFKPEKLTLGLPFYGKPVPTGYRELLGTDPDAFGKDMVVFNGQENWYNGADTLRKKVALAKNSGLGGVMIWEISLDTEIKEKSLLRVLGQAIRE